MIRPDWATPPDGDFARYVDQLMARAARARLQASTTPVDGFDGGSREAGAMHADAGDGPHAAHARTIGGSPGQAPVGPSSAWVAEIARRLQRWASSPGVSSRGPWPREQGATVRPEAVNTSPRPLASPRMPVQMQQRKP